MDSESQKNPKGNRRPNGYGAISWRKDGRWQATWHEDTPGGRKQRQVYGPTKEIAESKMWAARNQQIELVEYHESDREGHVYFIQACSGGPIKIGVANDVEKRMEQIQACCPYALQFLHIIPNGGIRLERKLHKRFAPYRLHGEWFENIAALLTLIYRLRSQKTKKRLPVPSTALAKFF